MSGFTVPNATDLAATLIASLDQAEPDSLDFKTVGNRRSGVVSGGATTLVASAAGNPTPAYLNVTLASSEVIIDGVYGTIAGGTVIVTAAPAGSTSRFDIICANYNAGTGAFTYTVVAGTASGNNPIFPSVTATQLPLYAVYVKSGFDSTSTTTVLVDKRVFTLSNTVRTGSTTPSNSLGNVGDLYVNTTVSSTGRQSQLYIKSGASNWENLAEFADLTGDVTTVGSVSTIATGAVVDSNLNNSAIQLVSPSGTVTQYIGATAPTGWLLCDGSTITGGQTLYPNLWAVLPAVHKSGSNIVLPNLKGRVPVGLDAANASFNAMSKTGGAETVTLDASTIPSHQHGIASIGHSNNSAVISADTSHNHSTSGFNIVGAGTHTHNGNVDPNGSHYHGATTVAISVNPHGHGTSGNFSAASGTGVSGYGTAYTASEGYHGHSFITDSAGSHSHTGSVTVDTRSQSHAHSITVDAHPSTSTALLGGGGAHNNLAPYFTLNYIIKV